MVIAAVRRLILIPPTERPIAPSKIAAQDGLSIVVAENYPKKLFGT